MLRDTFLQLLDGAERHAREEAAEDEGARILGDLPTFRRAADSPDERQVLHAMEKFLVHARSYALGNARLLAELEPFIGITLSARERLGGTSVLHVAP